MNIYINLMLLLVYDRLCMHGAAAAKAAKAFDEVDSGLYSIMKGHIFPRGYINDSGQGFSPKA